MEDHPSTPAPGASYADEASALDKKLDLRLDSIRRRTASGALSDLGAANERVEVLEDHLAAIRELRIRWFGSDIDPGWNLGTSNT
jgi:hypothetical protein